MLQGVIWNQEGVLRLKVAVTVLVEYLRCTFIVTSTVASVSVVGLYIPVLIMILVR
jgi:hypothetical protein